MVAVAAPGNRRSTVFFKRSQPIPIAPGRPSHSAYGPTSDLQLLVADLAGLPAAARIVEELAPDNEAIAMVEVAEEADLEYLPHRTNVTVIATVGTSNGDGESVLAQLVAAQPLPSGRGCCWFAGEAGKSRAVRKYLRGQHHWDARATRTR
jgi:NADPH-dependent ferric siderophore reductase